METTLNIDNKLIHFKFIDGADCWQTKTIIDNVDVEIEIDFQWYKDKEVNWEHFKDFLYL